ncbi:eukaryotic translation initiation factor 3, subunit 6 [Auricularia subglabra TFB-10046 SS5]|nr:eukaryotic translation initiation factor 3, subunit 6 [Auricularia subglabra TFB-10046 SS5]
MATQQYDLTQTIIPYLDRHLALPLLAHLVETGVFPAEQVRQAQYEVAKGTNMVDYAVSLFQQLHPDEEAPAEFAEKRDKALQTNERLQQEAQAVLDVIENPEVAQALRQDKAQNLQYLKEHFNVTLDQIAALYNFGQFQYTYGNYSGAADYLYHFRVLSTDPEKLMSAHWGKLASDTLSGKWDIALEELNALRDAIDARAGMDASVAQLQSRTWLLHWALFVYFNHPQGRTLLLETFLAPVYLNTIQNSAPWILRYLAFAAIVSRRPAPGVSARVRHALREIVKVVQTEEYQYSDPLTAFLKELYVEFDFEGAQRALKEAEAVVENDFFLNEFKDDFLENARYLISEAYCRIHQKIDIADLSERLNLSRDEGEKWIVNLIRETRMGADAKIDLEKNVIIISRPPQPIYQSVIEKTRGMAFRTSAIGAAIARAAAPAPPAPAQQAVEAQ